MSTDRFDAGTKADVFASNVSALRADLARVDALVVISHPHGNHTGGLTVALNVKPGLPVFLPFGSPALGSTAGRASSPRKDRPTSAPTRSRRGRSEAGSRSGRW